MSSDKLGSIQQPVVSVDFDLSESGQNKTESVELSKEELEKLISSLEAANMVITLCMYYNIHYHAQPHHYHIHSHTDHFIIIW